MSSLENYFANFVSMENIFNEDHTTSRTQMNSFFPVVPISAIPCYDSPLWPGATEGRNYSLPEYNIGLSHRELLKERIRQEMELEDKLRREILMERDYLKTKTMLPNYSHERSFNQGANSRSSEFISNGVVETMPFQRDPRAMVPKVESSVPQSAKERLLILPKKPSESGHVKIGFTGTPTTCVKATAGSAKNEKQNLRCSLCDITSTSAIAHEDHIKGQRHRKAKGRMLKVTKHKGKPKWGNNNKKRKRI